MGHEPAGIVDKVGSDVTEFRPGDRVLPYIFLIPPGSRWYQSSREQLCPEMAGVIGVKNLPGGYAERLRITARQLIRLPDSIAWKDAAVLCDAGLTAWHAIARSRIQIGETVVVIGVGGVGSFVVQLAKLAGANVVAVERSAKKTEWARSLGAQYAIDSGQMQVTEEVKRLTAGAGADCVLDIVGSRDSLAAGIDSLRVGGRLVVVGYTPDVYSLSAKRLAQNELELLGSRGGTRRDLAAVVNLMASGRIQSVVTQTRPLNQVNEALTELRQGNVLGRVVLELHS
jgi:2-desacetyl-2-hydroxyethyl bacteriochlorophyllide A dehydrogenase